MRIAVVSLTIALCTGLGAATPWRTPIDDAQQLQTSDPQETCGVVVMVKNECTGEVQIKAKNLSLKVQIPQEARAAFPLLKSTYTSAQVCVATVPPKPGRSFTVEARDPQMIRVVKSGPAAQFGAGASDLKTSGVVEPVLLRKVEPFYAPEAMRRQVQGEVWLDGVVLSDGTVGDVHVTKSLDPCRVLDDEAVVALKQWRFMPARLNGQPVARLMTFMVEFRLH
jgi:TonB family protein